MGLLDPDVGAVDGKFSEVVGEDKPFTLNGIEVLEGIPTRGYGAGDMVVLDVTYNGERKRLGIWGDYLLIQAKSVEPSDYGKEYIVRRGPVQGYSSRPDTKSLVLAVGNGAAA